MRLSRLAALAAAVVLLAAGCGGSGDNQGIASLNDASGDSTSTTTATAEVDPEQALLAYAQCMRDNGVEMEDPTVDENGNFQMMRPSGGGENGEFDPADRETMEAAREACSEYLEGVAQQFDRPDMTEMQDLLLEYAQCMRDHGVAMEDPDFSSEDGTPGAGGRLGFDTGDYDPSDPTFQEANEACQDIFGGTGMPGMMLGGGPGGGQGATPPEGSPVPEGTTSSSAGG